MRFFSRKASPTLSPEDEALRVATLKLEAALLHVGHPQPYDLALLTAELLTQQGRPHKLIDVCDNLRHGPRVDQWTTEQDLAFLADAPAQTEWCTWPFQNRTMCA